MNKDTRSIDDLLKEAPTLEPAPEPERRETVELVGRLRSKPPGRFLLVLGADGRPAFTVEGAAKDVHSVEVIAETKDPRTRVVRVTVPVTAALVFARPVSAAEAAQAQAWLLRPRRGAVVRNGTRPFVLLSPREGAPQPAGAEGRKGPEPFVLLDDSDPFGDPFRGRLDPGTEKRFIGDPNPIHLGGTQQGRTKEPVEDKSPAEDKLAISDTPAGLGDPLHEPPRPQQTGPERPGPEPPPVTGTGLGPEEWPKLPWYDIKPPLMDLGPPGPWGTPWLGGPTHKSPWQDTDPGLPPFPWKGKGIFDDLIDKLPPQGETPDWVPPFLRGITFPTPLFNDPGQSTVGLDYSWHW